MKSLTPPLSPSDHFYPHTHLGITTYISFFVVVVIVKSFTDIFLYTSYLPKISSALLRTLLYLAFSK